MSPFEPFRIFDSADDSAVHELSFINFHSCQSRVIMENNLYWAVIPCCHNPVAIILHVLCKNVPYHTRGDLGSLDLPITSTKYEIWIPVYKNVQPNAVFGALLNRMSTVRRLFECVPDFFISLFQLHELGPACKQYLNLTFSFLLLYSFCCAYFIVCSHVNFSVFCYSPPQTRHSPRFTTAILTSVYSSEPKIMAPPVFFRSIH